MASPGQPAQQRPFFWHKPAHWDDIRRKHDTDTYKHDIDMIRAITTAIVQLRATITWFAFADISMNR